LKSAFYSALSEIKPVLSVHAEMASEFIELIKLQDKYKGFNACSSETITNSKCCSGMPAASKLLSKLFYSAIGRFCF
jgi:hypothetical protein